jgi:hypothetical protein
MAPDGHVEEDDTKLVCGGDVDLGGRCYRGYPVNIAEIPDVGHLLTSYAGQIPCPRTRYICSGGAKHATAVPELRTGWIDNRDAILRRREHTFHFAEVRFRARRR